MTTLAEIEAAALALPDETRVALGRRLMDGVAGEPDDAPPPGILSDDAEGVREAERRLEAYRRGETAAYTLEEHRAHMTELRRRLEVGESREQIGRWLDSRAEPTHYYSGPANAFGTATEGGTIVSARQRSEG